MQFYHELNHWFSTSPQLRPPHGLGEGEFASNSWRKSPIELVYEGGPSCRGVQYVTIIKVGLYILYIYRYIDI